MEKIRTKNSIEDFELISKFLIKNKYLIKTVRKKLTQSHKENLSKTQQGKRNSNWQGGKSFELYPLGWNKTYKEQIRYRDGYKCQSPECGIPEVECRRKLDIHHIDYDKKNIKPENLISLQSPILNVPESGGLRYLLSSQSSAVIILGILWF